MTESVGTYPNARQTYVREHKRSHHSHYAHACVPSLKHVACTHSLVVHSLTNSRANSFKIVTIVFGIVGSGPYHAFDGTNLVSSCPGLATIPAQPCRVWHHKQEGVQTGKQGKVTTSPWKRCQSNPDMVCAPRSTVPHAGPNGSEFLHLSLDHGATTPTSYCKHI